MTLLKLQSCAVVLVLKTYVRPHFTRSSWRFWEIGPPLRSLPGAKLSGANVNQCAKWPNSLRYVPISGSGTVHDPSAEYRLSLCPSFSTGDSFAEPFYGVFLGGGVPPSARVVHPHGARPLDHQLLRRVAL